jgi:hypothetical protein
MSRERSAADAAKAAVLCKPDCQDSLCLCDDDTRHLRLLSYSRHLRAAVRELEDENAKLRERARAAESELYELELMGEIGGK